MLAAAIQAFRELFTPPFRAVLWKCVGFTIGLLALLVVVLEGLFSHFVEWPHWIETTIEWSGGLALVVGSIFLRSRRLTSLMAGLYLDDIAGQVERVFYPGDPPGKEMPALAAIGAGLNFFLVALVVEAWPLYSCCWCRAATSSPSMPATAICSWCANSSEMVAMRHLSPEEARRLRKANLHHRVPGPAWIHRRACLGADREPAHAAVRHGLHGACLQVARAPRRTEQACAATRLIRSRSVLLRDPPAILHRLVVVVGLLVRSDRAGRSSDARSARSRTVSRNAGAR